MIKKLLAAINVSVLLILCSCFVSCNAVVTEEEDDGAYFSITLPGASSRSVSDIASYEIILENELEVSVYKASPKKNIKITNLRICEYTIIVNAYDKNGTLIYQGIEEGAVPIPDNVDKQRIIDFAKKHGYDIDEDDIKNELTIKLYHV